MFHTPSTAPNCMILGARTTSLHSVINLKTSLKFLQKGFELQISKLLVRLVEESSLLMYQMAPSLRQCAWKMLSLLQMLVIHWCQLDNSTKMAIRALSEAASVLSSILMEIWWE